MRETARRRRQAIDLLRTTEAMLSYSATQIGNGLSPEQARQAVVETAAELAEVVVSLRRLARVGSRERRELAGELHAAGLTVAETAARLGVAPRTVAYYLAGRRSDGRPFGAAER
jgi:hypothetical protein